MILHLLALWASTLLSASMDTSTLRHKAVSINSANCQDVPLSATHCAVSPKVAGEGDDCDEGGEPEPPVHPCLVPCRGLAVLHVRCSVSPRNCDSVVVMVHRIPGIRPESGQTWP